MRAFSALFILPTITAAFSVFDEPRQIRTRGRSHRRSVAPAHRAFVGDDAWGCGEALLGDPSHLTSTEDAASSTDSIYAALRAREDQINRGIGRRYITRTQRGFLNVHDDPRPGPFCLKTIVGQLEEGKIVTSVGEPYGDWVQHDAGGWSVAEYNGVTWLEPIDD